MLLTLLLLVAFAYPVASGNTEIHSPRVTNWGHWHDWKYCPPQMLAVGMQVKAERDQRGRDDTGLNAVALYCELQTTLDYTKNHWIVSGEAPWGDWGVVKFCPKGQFIIGFALRSEPDQRGNDDVAADNFAAYCGTAHGPRNGDVWIQGDTEGWGSWTQNQFCPVGKIVCGIRSQIEGDQKGGDDTALNNVDLVCCEPAEVRCDLGYELVKIEEFDNSRGSGAMTVAFTTKTSFTTTNSHTTSNSYSEKLAVTQKLTNEIGFSGQGFAAKINEEISNTREQVTTQSLTQMVSYAITNESTRTLTVQIPPNTHTVIQQLFITCGDYRVGLAKTINKDYGV